MMEKQRVCYLGPFFFASSLIADRVRYFDIARQQNRGKSAGYSDARKSCV